MFVCVCVCVCDSVCVCVPYGAVVCAVDERLRVQFPTIMVTHVFLLFLVLLALLSSSWVVTNSQCMPEYVVWRVCVKKMEIGIHWPEKSHFNQLCGGYQAKN